MTRKQSGVNYLMESIQRTPLYSLTKLLKAGMRSAFDNLDYCYFSTIILIVTFQLNTPLVCRTPKGGYSGRLVSTVCVWGAGRGGALTH